MIEVDYSRAYDEPTKECPYCNDEMEADWVDVGVGSVQCGPYHCMNCGASEIGPEWSDWTYKDRDGKTIYLPTKKKYYSFLGKKTQSFSKSVVRYDAPVDKDEVKTGYYKGRISPHANTVDGILVDHLTAKKAYDVGMLDEKVREGN